MLVAVLTTFGPVDIKTTAMNISQDSTIQSAKAKKSSSDSLGINSNHELASFDEEKSTESGQKDKPRKRNRGLLAIGVLLIVVALILWIK